MKMNNINSHITSTGCTKSVMSYNFLLSSPHQPVLQSFIFLCHNLTITQFQTIGMFLQYWLLLQQRSV